MNRAGRPLTIAAVDPGLTGAIAIYCHQAPELITVWDMPVADKKVNPAAIARRLEQLRPDIAVVELVNAMPSVGKGAERRQMGAASSFKFGTGYGMVQGVIAALRIPIHLVTPGTWKKHFHLTANKEQARALAIKLWPASDLFERKKDAGRAEAALIARFAAETFGSHQVAA